MCVKRNSIDNACAFLEWYSNYAGRIAKNEFTCRIELNGKPISNFDLSEIVCYAERYVGIRSDSTIAHAINIVANKHSYNPVKCYLDNLTWDGQKRIEKLFVDLLEADDTELVRTMTKLWFIAAVRRIYEPGCKFDNMIILQGVQGVGKTSLCTLLSRDYSKQISMLGEKDTVMGLNMSWIVLIDELNSFNKKEMSEIKDFLSKQQDTCRVPYAKIPEDYLRHCVFIGSVNNTEFLRDHTSKVERRFWIIRCNKTTNDGKIMDVMTKEFVDQLWAEAVYYYNENPNVYLDIPAHLQSEFAAQQSQYKTYNSDSRLDYIMNILEGEYYVDEKGRFESDITFVSQVKGDYVPSNYQEQSKITKLPKSFLELALTQVYHAKCSPNDLKGLMLGLTNGWQYDEKPAKYNGKTYRGMLIREPLTESEDKMSSGFQSQQPNKQVECEQALCPVTGLTPEELFS